MLAIVGKFLSWSVDAGFVLALPLHHGDLELDSVGVSTKDRGAYLRERNTCARTSTENVGEAYTWDTTVLFILKTIPTIPKSLANYPP